MGVFRDRNHGCNKFPTSLLVTVGGGFFNKIIFCLMTEGGMRYLSPGMQSSFLLQFALYCI